MIAVLAIGVVLAMAQAAAATPATTPVAASAATASTADDVGVLASVTCTNGRLCIYKDTNFNGLARRFTVSENDYRTVNWWNFATGQETSDNMDNDASSVINKTSTWIRLYQDVGYNGRVICMGPQSSVHRLGLFTFDPLFNRTMDNRVSAHSLTRTDTCDFRVERNQNL
ncbi:peptidase inhibitor family I36 protein [Actinophytocola sp.]|uniref:peptidase inhibitor family I36 protein n=1 Tax=Actinophytocola sp. TaxID=1872138 RepID=UPI0025BCB3D5|nr:peptidase inhibitor family I36 protein [Actinophytocola sp.]